MSIFKLMYQRSSMPKSGSKPWNRIGLAICSCSLNTGTKPLNYKDVLEKHTLCQHPPNFFSLPKTTGSINKWYTYECAVE